MWLKQKIISQNIANKDTPNYKAQTVSFSAIWKEKIKRADSDRNDEKELNLNAVVTEEKGTSQVMEGNNVDIEKETISLADAQLQYDALAGKISNEFSMIRTAIRR